MTRVSDFDSWRIPLAIAIALTLAWGKFRGRLLLVMMAMCLIIGDGGIDWAFKLSINRPRPSETEPGLRVLSVREVTPSAPHHVAKGRSFTSGHACNNVALAMVGCAIFGRGGDLALALGGAGQFTRGFMLARTIRVTSSARGSWRSFTPT